MKFITALYAVGLVACLKSVPAAPPKAEVIDIQPGEKYMPPPTEGCNFDQVMDSVTEQCCPRACTKNGYDHDIHSLCAFGLINKAHCTRENVRLSSATSVCTCDEPEHK